MIQTTLDVRISWGGVLAGGFSIGISHIDSTDKFTTAFDAVFGGTYDNLSAITTQASWQRGRSDLGSHMLAGTGTIVVNDPTGIYNPANPSSPLVGQLKAMRPVYIKATDTGGIVRGCFRGYLQDVPVHDAARVPAVTTFTLVDLFAVLNGIFPTIGSTGPTTTGAAIAVILAAAGFSDSSFLSLATGDSIPDFSADGSQSALTLIGNLLAAEGGIFFANGSGVATYLDRNDRYARASVATLNGTMGSLQTGAPIQNVINRQTVTRTGGAAQQAFDAPSIGDYDYRDGAAITTPYLATDAAALDAATRIVAKAAQPRTLLTNFGLSSLVTGNLDQILQREFGDRITIPASGAGVTGTQGDFFIEQIAVNAVKGGQLDSTWILSARTSADMAFRIGVSTIAGTDPLAL